tara:strand:+ start:4286 stop:5041 length:756 start_codon:yes stop_codon:yes gene_type:complete
MNNKKIYTIYGINNAEAVLKSDSCIIKDIFLDTNIPSDSKIKKLISEYNFSNPVRNLNDYLRLNNSRDEKRRLQGVVITFNFRGIQDSISNFLGQKQDNNCVLILDQLEDPQNLGQIIRTCECAGVNKIILTQNKSVKISDSVLQVSQGAFCNISFYVCNNLRNTLKILKEEDYWLVALENSIESKNWYEIDLKGNIGIILGSEGKGIRRLTLEDSDFKATIPMQGDMNSLNVSATCSTILFERLRQIMND